MQIFINGNPREVSPGSTLRDLLEEFRQKKSLVVGEINGEIPSDENCLLNEGDRVEIVTFVGGG